MGRASVEGTGEAIGAEATAAAVIASRFHLTPGARHHHGNHLPLGRQVLGWVFLLRPRRRTIAADEVVGTAKEDGGVLLLGRPELIRATLALRRRTSTTGLMINIEALGDIDDSWFETWEEEQCPSWCDLYT